MAYRVELARLHAGSLVRVEAPLSSAGKLTYPHYFIVLFIPEAPTPGGLIPLVGITSRISRDNFDPAKHVTMKWLSRRDGDPDTGFHKPCVADITFTHTLKILAGSSGMLEVAAEFNGKFVRADKLQTIITMVNAFARKT